MLCIVLFIWTQIEFCSIVRVGGLLLSGADLRWGELGRPPQLKLGGHKYILFFSSEFLSSGGRHSATSQQPWRIGGAVFRWRTTVQTVFFLIFIFFCERFLQVCLFWKISKNGPQARRHGQWRWGITSRRPGLRHRGWWHGKRLDIVNFTFTPSAPSAELGAVIHGAEG
jgi:hypothetical protein